MIYISKQELMKSVFSSNKANALDVAGSGGSTLQSIFVGVNQLISSLTGQAKIFKSRILLVSCPLQQNKPFPHTIPF